MSAVDRMGIGMFALASAVTAGLGLWQVKRRQQKIMQIATRRNELSSSDAVLDADSTPPMFSRVTVSPKVRLNGSQQFLVGPRAGPVSVTGRSKGSGLSAGGLGYYVITPFEWPNGRVLLINRGWCRRDQAKVALGSVQDDLVAGSAAIIRPSEYSSANVTPAPTSNIFVRMDAEGMAERIDPNQPLPNFFAELIDETTRSPPHYLRRRSIQDFLRTPVSPDTHASYAFTWFALSAASAIIGTLRFRKRR